MTNMSPMYALAPNTQKVLKKGTVQYSAMQQDAYNSAIPLLPPSVQMNPNYSGWFADWREKRKAKKQARKDARAARKSGGVDTTQVNYMPPPADPSISGPNPLVYVAILAIVGGAIIFINKNK